MKTVVLKFGGTSVGSIDRIKKVCKIIASYKKKKNKVVVISSAMSGVTNDLVNKSKQISNNFDKAEYDTLVSTGEQVSCALIAGRLNHIGFKSRSWLSWQVPILTEGPYSGARISHIVTKEIKNYLKNDGIPIITGFQGINSKSRLNTIGRSGSDATAIMFAKFLNAYECIIYTDVDGVYTTDPREYKNAKKIKKIFYDEMLEMASSGSKVMQSRSVEFAKKFGVKFEVKSSLNNNPGTIVTEEHPNMESVVVRGISVEKEQAKVTIENVSDQPGVASRIFQAISESGVIIDMIVQNVSKTNHTDISFTLHRSDLKRAKQTIEPILEELSDAASMETTDGIGKLSVVGIGMRSHSGVAAQMFAALAKGSINIQMISTSEIKTAVIIQEEDLEEAANIVHEAFNL